MGKYAIFLGAGASASCGAPTQNSLFKEYFLTHRARNYSDEHELERELAMFFSVMFGIDVYSGDLSQTIFPTFEEALGILDLAILKNETLNGFESGSNNKLLACREYLVQLMASILYDKLSNTNNNHKQLIDKLRNSNIFYDTTFISTNYDLLIDNAISDAISNLTDYSLDYGFSFANIDIKKTSTNQIPLYKLHGSLNWLHCPTCNSMTSTGNEKGVIRLVRPIELGNQDKALCKRCNSLMRAVIIPPTYYKQFSNHFINSVWYNTEKLLQEVEKIIFCGYSFPDADMHIKYLLKRIETNTQKSLDIIVYNNHSCKTEDERDNEEIRYNRFFKKTINYTKKSFEQFIENPIEFL